MRRGLMMTVSIATLAAALAACGSSGSTGASGKADAATAEAFVKAHSAYPTSVGITTPLSKKPEAGKTIALISGTTSSSKIWAEGMDEAATALGWDVRHIQLAGYTPDEGVRAMNLALQVKPDAVVQDSFQANTFPDQVAKLKAAGVPYVELDLPDKAGDGITAVVGSADDFRRRGDWLANWVIADAKKSTDTVIFNISSFPVLSNVVDGFSDTYKRLCPDCSLDVQDVAASAIGTTTQTQITNYLQSHPKVKYVVATYGDLTIGLDQALRAVGIQDQAQVVTQTGGPRNFENLQNGTEAANVPESDPIMPWLAIDVIARTFNGDPVDPSQYTVLPGNILTKDNVKDPKNPYIAVPGYQDEFKKLWLAE
jgi:ribose transport system substrate-binding protein